MKRKIYKRYRTGRKKGGQRYWVGRKRNYSSGNLNAKEFTFVKDNHEVKVKDYEVARINQLMLQGYRIKKNFGSFTNLGISKQQNLERIRKLNERRKWAKELYGVDRKLKTTIEGRQRESLEKEREGLANRIGKSRDIYGDPIFVKRKTFGSFELDQSETDDIVIDLGRKVADKHRRQLAGLKGIAKDIEEKMAKEIPDDLGYIITKRGMRPIKIDEGAKSQIARDLIRTAENELVRQDIQAGLAKKLFGKDYFFELDKNQKSKVNRLIRKNIETNY